MKRVRRRLSFKHAASVQQTKNARADGFCQGLHFLGRRGLGWQESRCAVVTANEDAVDGVDVKVQVEIEGAAKALNEGDESGLRLSSGGETRVAPRASCVISAERTGDDDMHGVQQGVVVGEAVAKRVRKRQHPLSRGHMGKDVVGEVRGELGHAPAVAAWTEAPCLAAVGAQVLVLAARATVPGEAEAEHAAAQVSGERFADEAGKRAVIAALSGEKKGGEVVLEEAVEGCLLRPAFACCAGGHAALGARCVPERARVTSMTYKRESAECAKGRRRAPGR